MSPTFPHRSHPLIEEIVDSLLEECAAKGLERMRTKGLAEEIENAKELIYALGGEGSQVDIMPHPSGGLFACFPNFASRTIRTTSRAVQLRWFYQVEDQSFALAPRSSTEWVTELLFENDAVARSFAPTFLEGTRTLSSKGRARMTESLLGIRKLCNGVFAQHGDYYKCFVCSWRDGPRHCCPAKLYIVGCSQHLLSLQEIELQCVYRRGCEHHLDDKGRGKTRTSTVKLAPGMTPNGVCREVVKRAHPHALWAGNKSFGPMNTQAARKALSRQRLQNFSKGEDDVTSIKIAQKELASEDFQKDKFQRNSFYGYIHELLLTNTGDLRSVSIYYDLGVNTFAKLIERNPETAAIIDCTGNIVRDVWISKASDMALRSRKGNSKQQKASSKDGTKFLYDVLNFQLAVKLPSGTFIPIEAVIVERNAYTFVDILTGMKRRLRQVLSSGKGEHIRYFVCDMSPPFTIAVIYVFNQGMSLPEYLATRIFALKCGRSAVLRTTIVWCSVHAEREMRHFAREKFKTRDPKLLTDTDWLFKNIYLALCRTDSYDELCEMIGFIDTFISTRFLPAVGERHASKLTKLKTTDELRKSGEDILWNSLGGVPESASYDSLTKVQARSVQNKGYNPSHFEDA